MQPIYDYGDIVRVTRNVRNDGSFPGSDRGDLLIRRGEVGHVRNIGTFLQDQIIYTVHFLEHDMQVGCREEELIPATDPWVASRFENRDKVITLMSLAKEGEILVPAGTEGQIMKVIRNAEVNPHLTPHLKTESNNVHYHVHFSGHLLVVPESALSEAEPHPTSSTPTDSPELPATEEA